MIKLLKTLASFYDRSFLLGILFLSLLSGATFTLVSFTIPYQLSQTGYSTMVIGSIYLATLPYCFKPLWAPFIDIYSIPILCKRFGQRRGWMIVIQILLIIFSCGLSMVDPVQDLCITYVFLFTISLLAATQDIILDAYRIEESKTKEQLAIGVTCGAMGFRLGILLSSVGALYLSHIINWHIVYVGANVTTILGLIIVFYIKESSIKRDVEISASLISIRKYFDVIQDSISMLKQSQPRWKSIMLFIVLYKSSDSIPAAMSSPFLIDLSFTSLEIATISKAYGLLMMIFGALTGGSIVLKLGAFRGILLCGCIQLLSPIMFMILSIVGHDIPIFIATITLQNFCSGIGVTALMVYFSSLCNSKFIATQFAIIASFSSIARIVLSSLAGLFAHYLKWTEFFLANVLFSVLFLFVYSNTAILHKKNSIDY